ncbi:hypothetical protein CAL65_19040 [Alkalilimnicola ehrlichii]|uniref:Uncharacterized protein n=1 Tax=Alkalilimnicola ehrlichii TaxID=351052 RepID=A0A3E0WI91_9GAMM|nr:hypothetical protein CAL65_19040 [Alkalilimnicola ehrlichii]
MIAGEVVGVALVEEVADIAVLARAECGVEQGGLVVVVELLRTDVQRAQEREHRGRIAVALGRVF